MHACHMLLAVLASFSFLYCITLGLITFLLQLYIERTFYFLPTNFTSLRILAGYLIISSCKQILDIPCMTRIKTWLVDE
jgi:hypothetical protein